MNWRPVSYVMTIVTSLAITPGNAIADDGVTLVGSSGGILAKRIREEMLAVGIPVQEETSWPPEAATTSSASLVVVLPQKPNQPVEIWWRDPKTLQWSRVESIARTAEGAAIDTRAVRTCELVRALRQQAGSISQPPDILPLSERAIDVGEPAPLPRRQREFTPIFLPAARPPSVKVKSNRATLAEVSVSLVVSAQYFGPAISATLGGRWHWSNRFSTGIFADLPILGASITTPEGTATFRTFNAGLEAAGVLFRRRQVIGIGVAGVALSTLIVAGDATPPFGDRNETVVVAMPFIGAELRPRITQTISMVFGIRVASSVPHVDVFFGGRNVGTWGTFVGAVHAGVALDL